MHDTTMTTPLNPAAWPPRPVVIYVDDDPVNQLVVEGVLSLRPALDLRLASTAQEALALCAQHPPALLLADLQLPDFNGAELLLALRERGLLREARSVLVTAQDPGLAGAFARDSGFDACWSKPLDVQAVLAALDAWFPPAD
jgi:CheY-like chemotaxis protein